MKHTIGVLLLAGLTVTGCATRKSAESHESDNMYGDALMGDVPLSGKTAVETDAVQSDQMLIWTGSIAVEVASITNAQQQITALTKKNGGYVESSSQQVGSGL